MLRSAEKPDALWDRPDLERLYARLEDEYELKERVDALNRKLAVVAETANTLADIIDTRRSLRLEIIVVVADRVRNRHHILSNLRCQGALKPEPVGMPEKCEFATVASDRRSLQ